MLIKFNNYCLSLFIYLFIIINNNIFAKNFFVNTLFVDIYAGDPNIWLFENKKLSLPDQVYALFGKHDSKYILRSTQALKYDLVESECEEIDLICEYIRVKHPYYYYFNDLENKLDNRFWIKKDFLTEVSSCLENINGTIINPIYDENNNLIFLPGTRVNGEVFDKKILLNNYFFIEKEDFIFDYEVDKEDENELRNRFLNILNNWISLKSNEKVIPYVWGGTTILKYVSNNCFKKLMKDSNEGFFWNEGVVPCIGIDCSGLVCLGARIAGFDFYLRNSFSQMKYLRKLNLKKDEIKKGDILWIPGHVIILNPEDDSCIESASYSSGYCGVVKNKIKNRFVNITSINDFIDLKINKESIKIKSKDGKISEYNNFEILDLYSCFCIDYSEK
jgi:hypothetical protein